MLWGGCGGLFRIVRFIDGLLVPTASPRLSEWIGRLEVSGQSKVSNHSRHVLQVGNIHNTSSQQEKILKDA